MSNFNEKLHEFLLGNETCFWCDNKNELNFGVHVWFDNIKDFIDIVGEWILDEGGVKCDLNNTFTLYIPLEDIFTNDGLLLSDYLECFNEWDIKNYTQEIKVFDGLNEE